MMSSSPLPFAESEKRESDTRDWHKFGFPEERMSLRNAAWLRDPPRSHRNRKFSSNEHAEHAVDVGR